MLSFSVSAFAGLTKDHAIAHPIRGTASLLPPRHDTPTWNDVERTVTDVLELAQHAGAAYARASGDVRRQLNRAFFTRIIVDAETIQGAEVTETFAAIVTEDVIRRAAIPRDEANPAAEPWEGYDVRGSTTFRLVPPTGFEPVPPP